MLCWQSEDTGDGMTYREDVAAVKESFWEMIERGEYREESIVWGNVT